MALAVYPKAKREILKATIDFDAPNDFRVLLLKSSATYDATDEFVADVIAGSSEISVSGYARLTLTGEVVNFSTPDAFFDANDPTTAALTAGQTIGAAVLFKFVTNDADSPVIAWFDGGVFPVATSGGTLTIQWNTSGLLQLA